jgi:hypothetical protein
MIQKPTDVPRPTIISLQAAFVKVASGMNWELFIVATFAVNRMHTFGTPVRFPPPAGLTTLLRTSWRAAAKFEPPPRFGRVTLLMLDRSREALLAYVFKFHTVFAVVAATRRTHNKLLSLKPENTLTYHTLNKRHFSRWTSAYEGKRTSNKALLSIKQFIRKPYSRKPCQCELHPVRAVTAKKHCVQMVASNWRNTRLLVDLASVTYWNASPWSRRWSDNLYTTYFVNIITFKGDIARGSLHITPCS